MKIDIEELEIITLDEEVDCDDCGEELIVGEKVLWLQDSEGIDYYYCLSCSDNELDDIIKEAKSIIEEAEKLKKAEQ